MPARARSIRRVGPVLFALTAVVYLLGGPTFLGYDGSIMLRVTESLFHNHSFQITDPIYHYNQPYSYYGLGVSLLLLPFYAAGSWLLHNGQLLVNLYEPAVTALTVVALRLLLLELGCTPRRSLLISLLYAFGTMAWQYSGVLFSEPLVALCLVTAALALLRYQRLARASYLFWAGTAVGVALLARFDSALLIALPMGVYAAVAIFQAESPWRHRLSAAVAFVAPMSVALIADLAYNVLRTGNLMGTGYPGGFTSPLLKDTYGLLFGPGVGLFVFVPVLLLSIVTFPAFARNRRSLAILVVALLALRVLFFARWWSWDGGGSWGPRFLVPLIPLLLLPLALAPWSRWMRVAVIALGSLSVGIEALAQVVWYNPYAGPIAARLPYLHLSGCKDCGFTSMLDVQKVKDVTDFSWQYSPIVSQAWRLLHGDFHPIWLPIAPLLPFLLAGIGLGYVYLFLSTPLRGLFLPPPLRGRVGVGGINLPPPLRGRVGVGGSPVEAVADSDAFRPLDTSLGVIVPVYNEARTLEHVLGRVLEQPEVRSVVVVDDGSTDGSAEVAARFSNDRRLSVYRHPVNRGKGAAVRTALQHLDTGIVIIQDADLEYDPAEYGIMIKPIVNGRADVVYGVRGFLAHTSYSYWFVVGNRLVTTATNILFNCYISDMESGFKAMRTDLMRRLCLRGDRFDIEPEITGRVLRLGYRIHEVPITYYARGREEGKKLTWRDGVMALLTLLRIRLTPYRWLFEDDSPYHSARLRALAASNRLPQRPSERAS